MTGHAHAHRQRVRLRNSIFSFNRAMTLLAAKAGGDVAAVIEGDVIGQVINLDPFERFVLLQRRRDLLNLRRILPDLRVAVHAGARCRYPCDP